MYPPDSIRIFKSDSPAPDGTRGYCQRCWTEIAEAIEASRKYYYPTVTAATVEELSPNCHTCGVIRREKMANELEETPKPLWGLDTVVHLHTQLKADYIDIEQAKSTDSIGTISTIRNWIALCTTQHLGCRRRSDKSSHPTRLIDVGDGDSNTARLVCTAESGVEGPYITLSHCWGKHEFLQLTDATLQTFQEEIPIQDLPKTFREAIDTTRRLGVRYLWIDSLCIIQKQKSHEDWLKESPKMRTVYMNSLCNLAATAASDSRGGLFHDRNPSAVFPEGIPGLNGLGPKIHTVEKELWKTCVLKSPLLERGWVVQERLLAQRIVHFGSDQVMWECNTAQACERFPGGMPGHQIFDTSTNTKSNLTPQVAGGSNSWTPIPELWERIVHQYSQTKLTYASDRLIAVSGLAESIGETSTTRYLAGLWEDDIHHQLLWSVDGKAMEIPSVYRCPSFSWASVDGRIEYDRSIHSDESLVRLQQVNLDYVDASSNPYSHVRGGRIVLTALSGLWILSAELQARHVITDVYDPSDQDMIHYFLPVCSTFPGEVYELQKGLCLVAVDLRTHVFRRVGFSSLSYKICSTMERYQPVRDAEDERENARPRNERPSRTDAESLDITLI